ncbi:MAG: hypothetical protein ACK4SM_01165 [Aquificaceae bacterium]
MNLLLFLLTLLSFSNGGNVESIMKKDIFPELSGKTDASREIFGYVKIGKKGYVFYEEGGKLKKEPFGQILDIKRGKMYIKRDKRVESVRFKFARKSADKGQRQENRGAPPPLQELLDSKPSGRFK